MKAILVIDVDGINRFHAHVYKEDDDGNGELVMSYLPFKPMPQMKYSLECCDSDGNRWKEPSEYDIGYNMCIDEILGGNK